MEHTISDFVIRKISSFYDNISKKYPHTYSYEDIDRDVLRVYNEAFKVGTIKLWRKSNINALRGWENYLVDYSKETGWYFAYKIENDIIYIEDAENYKNMSEGAFRY